MLSLVIGQIERERVLKQRELAVVFVKAKYVTLVHRADVRNPIVRLILPLYFSGQASSGKIPTLIGSGYYLEAAMDAPMPAVSSISPIENLNIFDLGVRFPRVCVHDIPR